MELERCQSWAEQLHPLLSFLRDIGKGGGFMDPFDKISIKVWHFAAEMPVLCHNPSNLEVKLGRGGWGSEQGLGWVPQYPSSAFLG